jgi:hypothetical protein
LKKLSFIQSNILILTLAGPIPLRVREASIPIVNDNECVRKINAVTEKIFILPASSFCAGGEEGHDACQVRASSYFDSFQLEIVVKLIFSKSIQGDGGGPMVCEDSGYYELTGMFT